MLSGHIQYDEGQIIFSWWFGPRMSDEQVEQFCETNHIQESYMGPGMPFGNRPVIRHTTRRTLITQRTGWDT